MFSANEILHVYCYRDIYESSYDIRNPEVIPTGKIIFCEACYIKEFFEALKNHPERKIILLSCESDYGICYQQEYWSNRDVHKAFYRVNWEDVAKNTKYATVQLSACKHERCYQTDKFVSKIDGMTDCSFNEIPNNVVKWFCCNLSINEPRVEFLPYGVNSQGDLGLFEEFYRKTKVSNPKSLYVNFDVNTLDRANLKEYWKSLENQAPNNTWMTYVHKAKPVREFYEDIVNHDFILSPRGNGADGFRNYESCYLGSIPLCESNPAMKHMIDAGFPIILLDSLYGINKRLLDEIKSVAYDNMKNINWKILQKSYWFDKIHKAAKDVV